MIISWVPDESNLIQPTSISQFQVCVDSVEFGQRDGISVKVVEPVHNPEYRLQVQLAESI
jgi:hypothetical protein